MHGLQFPQGTSVVHMGGLTCPEIGLATWYLVVALFACSSSENSHDLANWEAFKV